MYFGGRVSKTICNFYPLSISRKKQGASNWRLFSETFSFIQKWSKMINIWSLKPIFLFTTNFQIIGEYILGIGTPGYTESI